MKLIVFYTGLILSYGMLSAQDAGIVPLSSPIYRQAEEFLLNEGYVPPLDEKPMTVGKIKSSLGLLQGSETNAGVSEIAGELESNISLPGCPVSPILEFGFSATTTTEKGRVHMISTKDHKYLDYMDMYQANALPSLITTGFIINVPYFSCVFEPELRAVDTALLQDGLVFNIPFYDLRLWDINFPYRGIASFYLHPFEVRFGRDKLDVGPGEWSTLVLSQNMPYFDFLNASFDIGWFRFSWYYISLNSTITAEESDYLDNIYKNNTVLVENAAVNGKPYVERVKTLILSRLTYTPFRWCSLSLGEYNMIGGRQPEISDFNPFMIYHNTFQEGTYGVPLSISGSLTPLRGVKFYFDYLLWDIAAGDETGTNLNPSSSAYQIGMCLLSQPYFSIGPGRFRLDAEWTLVDPWVYNEPTDLRKFTQRIIHVESFVGRFWVDYPLGFYLGPDSTELCLNLSYGIPGNWEYALEYILAGTGQIDLYGWGSDSDYIYASKTGNFITGAPTGTAQWVQSMKFSFYNYITKKIRFNIWYSLKYVNNRYNVSGDNEFYNSAGIIFTWKVF